MRLWTLGLVAAMAVLATVQVAAVHVAAVEDCCYGTQCAAPDPNQCIMRVETTQYMNCKRTCAGDCTQGNGCCQWIRQRCYYIKKFPTATCPGDSYQNTGAIWWNNKFCRPQGQGNEVECLETASNWCRDP